MMSDEPQEQNQGPPPGVSGPAEERQQGTGQEARPGPEAAIEEIAKIVLGGFDPWQRFLFVRERQKHQGVYEAPVLPLAQAERLAFYDALLDRPDKTPATPLHPRAPVEPGRLQSAGAAVRATMPSSTDLTKR